MTDDFKTLSPELLIVNLLFALERIKPGYDFWLGNESCKKVSGVLSVTSQEVTMEMIMVLWIQNYNLEWEVSCQRRQDAEDWQSRHESASQMLDEQTQQHEV